MGKSELSKSFIAGNLKNLRKYCFFKTLGVAEFLNLTSSAYDCYETGRTMPPLRKPIRIAVLYEMAV